MSEPVAAEAPAVAPVTPEVTPVAPVVETPTASDPTGFESYGLHIAPEGVEDWDVELGKQYAEALYAHKAPVAVAKAIAEIQINAQKAAQEKAAAEETAWRGSQVETLKAAWGVDAEKNVQVAARAATALGIDLDAIGDAALIQVFHKLSPYVSVDGRLSASPGEGNPGHSLVAGESMADARDIVTNPLNPKHKLYHSGHHETVQFVERIYAQNAE